MAQTITLLKDFAGGQGGGASSYVTYADDFDSNFTSIETAVNQLVNEVKSTLSVNSLFTNDILQFNDPLRAGGTVLQGVIGNHSYSVSVGAPTTQLDVTAGSAMVNNLRVSSDVTQNVVGTGPSDSYWIILDTGGALRIEQESATPTVTANEVVIAVATWNGSAWTEAARPDRIADLGTAPDETVPNAAGVFFDGDTLADIFVLASDGNFIMRVSDGSASEPGLSFVDDTDIGLFRIGTNLLGFTAGGTELMRLDGVEDQVLVTSGDLANPGLAFTADVDTGLYLPSVGVMCMVVAGTEVFRFNTTSMRLGFDGTEANPAFTWTGDINTGIRRVGEGHIALVSNGEDVLEVDDNSQVVSDTQFRFDFSRGATQSITEQATFTAITFDTEVADVGGWATVSTTDLTVPTGGDGWYVIAGTIFFAAQDDGYRHIRVEVDGTPRGYEYKDFVPEGTDHANSATEDWRGNFVALINLAAGEVLTLEVAHNGHGAGNVNVTGARMSGIRLVS